jgi:hypothetical protein
MVTQVIKGTAFGSLTVAERSGKFAVFITHNDEVRINRNNTAQIDVAETCKSSGHFNAGCIVLAKSFLALLRSLSYFRFYINF